MDVVGDYQVSLIELATNIGYVEDTDAVVTGIQTELDKVIEGDVWCRLSPTVSECEIAKSQGAVAILCQSNPGYNDLSVWECDDYEHALGLVLNYFYHAPTSDMSVVAVTGTNGKTTVSYLCTMAMRYLQKQALLIGTLGRGVPGQLRPQRHTTPPASELHQVLASARDQEVEFVAMEASSHGLDQGRLAGVMVDVAVFTNLTHEHLDYHQTIQAYLEAKQKLFRLKSVGASVINVDDPSGEVIAANITKAKWACSLVSVPRGFERWSYGAVSQSSLDATTIKILTHDNSCRIETKLIGQFNCENLVLAHAALCMSGVEANDAARALGSVDFIPGRMQKIDFKELVCDVYVDYSHTPSALERVLSEMDRLKAARLWVVFGCGGDRDKEKRPLMGTIAERYADEVVLTEDNSRSEEPRTIISEIQSGMKSPQYAHVYPNRYDAIRFVLREAQESDIVIIAGKGHETIMEMKDGPIDFSDVAAIEAILSQQCVE